MSVNRSIAALGSWRQILLQPWLQSLGARHEEWACVELPQLQVLRHGNFWWPQCLMLKSGSGLQVCESNCGCGAKIWNVSMQGVQDVVGLGLRATQYHGGEQWLLLGGCSIIPFSGCFRQ